MVIKRAWLQLDSPVESSSSKLDFLIQKTAVPNQRSMPIIMMFLDVSILIYPAAKNMEGKRVRASPR